VSCRARVTELTFNLYHGLRRDHDSFTDWVVAKLDRSGQVCLFDNDGRFTIFEAVELDKAFSIYLVTFLGVKVRNMRHWQSVDERPILLTRSVGV
jgi:hypothetical protein